MKTETYYTHFMQTKAWHMENETWRKLDVTFEPKSFGNTLRFITDKKLTYLTPIYLIDYKKIRAICVFTPV